jgi:hypothetical protein
MSIDKSIRQYYDVPGTKKIEGQLHKLAYITPKEAKLLQKTGAIKTKTPAWMRIGKELLIQLRVYDI